jgi:protein ImuB
LSNGRRYLAVWFPWLPSDRVKRQDTCVDTPDDTTPTPVAPMVMVEKVKGALRLSAVDPDAARQGLSPGLALADARARMPVLRVVTARPEADDAWLGRVLDDFDRFSPMIALDPPHGLVLDVTGCAHLFGGETGLIRVLRSRASQLGLHSRCALASTPQAARALCRFGAGGVPEGEAERTAVRRLPVAALELEEHEAQGLRRAGLKRVGDLDDRDRAPLAARFGAGFPARLARVLGDEDIRITPHRPAPPIVADRIFFEPVSADEDVQRVLSDLMEETMTRLEEATLGARAFEAGFYRVDGGVRRIELGVGRVTRDAKSVLRLFRERLRALDTPLDPGFGFDQMRMAAIAVERLEPVQVGLAGDADTAEGMSALIDRLVARLGPEAVLRFQPNGSHIPERGTRWIAAGGDPDAVEAWPEQDPDDPPLRPLHLFNPPQPVETLAEAPDGHPFRFRWRKVVHNVARAEGPERIAGEWWRAPDQRTRDYYRVEDADGRRFWLFRQGLYGGDEPPRWFIHGLFA